MNKNGIWDQSEADKYHQSSPKLAKWIEFHLVMEEGEDDPVYDFGCGNGYYLHQLSLNGFTCVGFEGYMLNNFIHSPVVIHDLTQPIHIERKGSVISLEVGEHLPKSAEQTFLDTITDACKKTLIISWALPGQPGVGHINCQPQDYIISEIERRGFSYMPNQTMDGRDNVDPNCDWFERTLLVFTRK